MKAIAAGFGLLIWVFTLSIESTEQQRKKHAVAALKAFKAQLKENSKAEAFQE